MSERAAPLARPADKNPLIPALLSLVVPGAGQFYLGARTAGIAIFAMAATMAFLIQFSLDNFRLGLIDLNGFQTSWLWVWLIAFWVWNVWDAYGRAKGRAATRLLAFGIPILFVYLIAWQVTDVNLIRLVTRFNDVKIIFNALVHPDFTTRATETQSGTATIWVPCANPPQPRPERRSGLLVQLDKSCGTVRDTIFVIGDGFKPNTSGNLYWLELDTENAVQVRSGGQPVVITTGPDGRFGTSVTIPTFAGTGGIDPANPVLQGVEARFVQEVGPVRPSETFGDLIGKVREGTPPGWMVSLGLAAPDATIPIPIPGKIFETIALGLMATLVSIIVAAPLSFLGAHNIMGRLRGGNVIYYLVRAVFNFTRSIDTLIWAIIFVVWVGLGAFAGLLALSLHSIAALAKLYSEEVEHIDPGPVEAVTAAGANTVQAVRYAVIPQIVPPFLAYSLLRWDINMRSATVVGFVSAAGVGFMIVESIRKGGFEIYAAALWCIAVVIIIVDYLSSYWRDRILRGDVSGGMTAAAAASAPAGAHGTPPTARPPQAQAAAGVATAESRTAGAAAPRTGPSQTAPVPFYKTPRGIVYSILLLIIFVVSWNLSQVDLGKLLSPGSTFGKVVSDFVLIDTSSPVWEAILKNLLVTIFQALLATTFGGVIALPFGFLAARNITGRTRATAWIYYIARFILNFLRSIEAILYVAIFVFWVGIGAFAGTLALAVTTFGLIGKLFSEAVENIEEGPVEAVTATGANRLQSIAFAIFPQIIPPFISYAIYQWDINIRLATIIGFAGGGGIGLLFSNYTGQLQYHKAGAVILSIVLVVTAMDFASAKIRERLV